MLKRYLLHLFASSMRLNKSNILRLIARAPGGALLDLGCDDGLWTQSVARAARRHPHLRGPRS